MLDINRLRVLTKRGDKEAAKILWRSAKRRNDESDMNLSIAGVLLGKGALYHDTVAIKCRRGFLYAPLWTKKNRRILAIVYQTDNQGSCKIVSFDFSRELFFIHEWHWGSCEVCDAYMRACEELWREDYYGLDGEGYDPDGYTPEPASYMSQEDLDNQFREDIEIRSTSYTVSELFKLRDLYLDQTESHDDGPNYMVDVIGYILGFVDKVPSDKPEWLQFAFYARVENFNVEGPKLTAKEIWRKRRIQTVNDDNNVSFNQLGEALKKQFH